MTQLGLKHDEQTDDDERHASVGDPLDALKIESFREGKSADQEHHDGEDEPLQHSRSARFLKEADERVDDDREHQHFERRPQQIEGVHGAIPIFSAFATATASRAYPGW